MDFSNIVINSMRMDIYHSSQPFQPHFLPGEDILWSGRPKQGLYLRAADAFLIPISIIWGGFAIIWNALVWLTPSNTTSGISPAWLFRLLGLPFLLAGTYMIIGRFIHDALIRMGRFYAVTSQRVLILSGSALVSLDIHRLPRFELSEHRDGTGTINFEPSYVMPFAGWKGFRIWLPPSDRAIWFFRIQNARHVYELIRKQRRS